MVMYRVTNVKFHCRITGPRLKVYQDFFKNSNSPYVTKRHRSFMVIRLENKAVYTCFYSGFINVTGVKSVSEIEKIIHHFAGYLGISWRDFSPPKIDCINSVFVTSKRKKVNLKKLAEILSAEKYDWLTDIRYNREKFPGMTIKTLIGSILIFPSFSILLTGTKSEQETKVLSHRVENILKQWMNAVVVI